ncbi:ATP-binding protein [Nocardiopsis sp. N85]|uniref:ATP-binding protein n=1 Tax=Nocardiopsis sp. N85 TaxID=3029400 RepID=UPI00237FC836|nr:ATP-binding protein [Nocardiopsis sp. N85]MDE3722109.1 ATP-binding protein [Nocardiopsis sp. N85]
MSTLDDAVHRVATPDTLAREFHRLPGTLACAARARGLLGRFLHRLGQTDLADSAQLVVSELVANAVEHGLPPVDLTMTWLTDGRPTLRVDVCDHGLSGALPAVLTPADEAESGRGLLLVEHVTDRWGIVPHPVTGTHAWAELRTA